ncbi:hypothetical protein KA017_00160 [Candidatus Woesebacteria bacterium]|nr:hypothetical protein [Candidatus Woesebacteria bacterium]
MGDLPYEPLIRLAVQMGHIRSAEQKSHKIDPAYFGWEFARRNGVPLDERQKGSKVTYKTGFERYFIGTAHTSEELLAELLKVGEDVWNGMKLLHRMNPMRLQELKKTILSDEVYTISTVVEWSGALGAQLGRLRMNLLRNPAAQSFQLDTRQAVAGLPKIEYTLGQSGPVEQSFQLPVLSDALAVLTYNGLTEQQKLYWEIVSNLGKFGHPLVRTAIEELYKYSDSAQFAYRGGLRKTA